jgi:hypothetical protein
VRAALAIVAAALLLAGCGGSDEEPPGDAATTPGADTATATAPATPPEEVAPAETVTRTIPAPPPVTSPTPAPTQPEEAPGGAGDEEGIAVQTRFVLGADGSLSPRSADVPAFLGTAVIVENADDTAHRLEVGDRGAALPVGRTTILSLPGRAPTELPVLIDGNEAATLRVVAERP